MKILITGASKGIGSFLTSKFIADGNEVEFSNVVKISGNVVNVRLSEKGGYQYSFFNDVSANAYPEKENGEYTGNYIFTINKK